MRPFIIYALPRSRTNWLSHLLTYRDWTCWHEIAVRLREVGDIPAFFGEGKTGTAETGVSPGWRLIRHYVPHIKAVVIRRPVDEVAGAMMRIDLRGLGTLREDVLRTNLRYRERCLEQISAQPGTLTFRYDELGREEVCRTIFEHCLPYPFDRKHWLGWKDRNTQVDVREAFEYYLAFKDRVEAFKRACWADMRRLKAAGAL